MAVEAVGFAYAPTHLYSVYGMADFFLGNRDEELWARGWLAVGSIRGLYGGSLGGGCLGEGCEAGGVDGPHGAQGVGHDRMRSGIAAVKELAYSNLAA